MAVRQLTLDLGHQGAHDREDLIVTGANALAVELVDAWPAWPGPAVVLAGPAGSGKSHIARAWASAAGATVLAMADLESAGAPDGSRFVIEDAAPGAIPEKALFHLLNHVRAEGGHCLLTSRLRPAMWGVALPDLASRLRAAQFVELAAPDDDLLRKVVVKLFADRQVAISTRVTDYLVARMERSLEAAVSLVGEIDREALSRAAPVTRAVVAEVLARSAAEEEM